MTRRLVLGPEQVVRVRDDPRYVSARSAATVVDPGWRTRGSCLSVDPRTFFPDPPEQVTAAVAVCAECPVKGNCLAAALTTGEPEGVWGGTTPSERRAMRVVWTGRF